MKGQERKRIRQFESKGKLDELERTLNFFPRRTRPPFDGAVARYRPPRPPIRDPALGRLVVGGWGTSNASRAPDMGSRASKERKLMVVEREKEGRSSSSPNSKKGDETRQGQDASNSVRHSARNECIPYRGKLRNVHAQHIECEIMRTDEKESEG